MTITQFMLEEVRCFANRQRLDIRPLTFLVGENSTGKTTALACFSILSSFLRDGVVDFNSQPYSMGIFRDIVRRSNIKEKAFGLGLTIEDKNENIECNVRFKEKAGGIEPVIESVTVRFCDGELVFEAKEGIEWGMKYGSYNEDCNQHRILVSSSFLEGASLFHLFPVLSVPIGDDKSEGEISLADYLRLKSEKSKRWPTWSIMNTISVFDTAPVRSRPKRTYDATREYDDPEGSDVPMRLMRIEATKKDEWEALKRQLLRFGRASGLFQNIKADNLGRSLGAPFQINVKVKGPNSNIVDVGYGVSQVLPILVHVLTSSIPPGMRGRRHGGNAFYLLQQPEVHLHPKAQAELSSLLAQLANGGNKSFIVETHSDYMIDRARIEIRKGNINKEDVSLIYLEPKKNVVNVHNISFDEMGNMIGVPPHFREFFLLESDRLMGFAD